MYVRTIVCKLATITPFPLHPKPIPLPLHPKLAPAEIKLARFKSKKSTKNK